MMSDKALITLPPPARPRRGYGFAIGLLFLLFAALASLCGWRWLVVLPIQTVQALNAQTAQIRLLDQRLRALENREPEPAPAASLPPASEDTSRMQKEVGGLSASLASLQGEVHQLKETGAQTREATQGMVSAALAFLRLDTAARSDDSFAQQLARLQKAAAHMPSLQEPLAQLEPYMAGRPSVPTLQKQWDILAPRIARAIDKSAARNWRERLMAELKSLISIRSLNDPAPDNIAAVDTALAKGDLPAALAAFDAIPVDARNLAGDWRDHLDGRRLIDDALSGLAARFDDQLNPPAGTTP